MSSPSGASASSKQQGASKYFQTTKRGEIKDWKDALNSFDKEKVKEAVKKVIAAMTVGKDVSVLFPDIIKSMPTDNLELKKLVYLYIINYARSQPDKAILVINTFQKDASKLTPNPLVRALAIRTMGCIRLDRIAEHLCEPLGRALEDEDPYVRKTAAICVAKLFDMNKELVEERGFIEKLRSLLSDASPMVVANAVAALTEISETGQRDIFKITPAVLQQLLTALNECTEWGQVFILDALSRYEPTEQEAMNIIERVTPRLKHSNSGLVLSSIRIIMRYLDIIQGDDAVRQLIKKLSPPLVTLLSAEPEIQYVALRNMDLIVQKRPDVLSREIRVFFCKYNDPVYVKMEKLEIMIKLSSGENIDQLLLEFKEYAQAVDVEFVRKAVRAIGRCAIKLEEAAERCVKVLLELIDTKVAYVVQEAVVVIKDIFRRYPNRYEGVIVNLCANLDSLDEPEAKAAMIWIIGEYAERIEDAGERLESWIDTFEDEAPETQMQLLTATVKLFLKRPDVAKEMIRKVLDLTTENIDNPDLRDRGYVYWRLLATDPESAKKVVLADKPVISDDTFLIDPKVLDVLIANIATLASVYHKPPESFVRGITTLKFLGAEDTKEEEEEEEDEGDEEDDEKEAHAGQGAQTDNREEGGDSEEEDEEKTSPKSPGSPTSPSRVDFPESKKFAVLSKDKGNGLAVLSSMTRKDGAGQLVLRFQNNTAETLNKFAVQFNTNYLGVSPQSAAVALNAPIAPSGGTGIAYIPLDLNKPPSEEAKQGIVQVALKTQLGILYFASPLSAHVFFEDDGEIGKKQFLESWKGLPAENEFKISIDSPDSNGFDADNVVGKLNSINVFVVMKLEVKDRGTCIYGALKLKGETVLTELAVNGATISLSARSGNVNLASVAAKSLKFFFTQS
eukprot:TRINITY_DN3117_c0_g1_i1.p1 TRINITY_DN3117_c0_g1~~TRINITY_DN3117_c0_g1_i1.p1  ORF type:complete len:905 (-),score=341.08 TRINITY_DN3117_c0_g1_i1:61-2775(-)